MSEEDHEWPLFQTFGPVDGTVKAKNIRDVLLRNGLTSSDPRLLSLFAELGRTETFNFTDFCRLVQDNLVLVERAIKRSFVIPDFPNFVSEIGTLFEESRSHSEGHVATYIPILSKANPELWGLAICTTDGQRASFGDSTEPFCVQSCSKPISYLAALRSFGGLDKVHEHVGREPSGVKFNELTLSVSGLPHNPLINSGAIMTASMVFAGRPISERFESVLEFWKELAGGIPFGFSNPTYLSEKATADRNFALGYYMQEKGAFPPNTDLIETLEMYFQFCSIEATCESLAVIAATLANYGICPLSGKDVLSAREVENCLSLMGSCGMYDYSGEFAFTIGLPAKSGVAGAIMVVVPGVMGFATFSPRLDAQGNSSRGIRFCQRLNQRFNFHVYAPKTHVQGILSQPDSDLSATEEAILALIQAASDGNIEDVMTLALRKVDLDSADYDGRTPLHLAACSGHVVVVKYLLQRVVNSAPKDRWDNTPLDDARRLNQQAVVDLLTNWKLTPKQLARRNAGSPRRSQESFLGHSNPDP